MEESPCGTSLSRPWRRPIRARDDVEDGRERLLVADRHVVARTNEGGRSRRSGRPLEHPAAREDLAALVRLVDGPIASYAARLMRGPMSVPSSSGSPTEPAVRRDQPAVSSAIALVEEESPHRGAALARRSHGAEQDAARREVEVAVASRRWRCSRRARAASVRTAPRRPVRRPTHARRPGRGAGRPRGPPRAPRRPRLRRSTSPSRPPRRSRRWLGHDRVSERCQGP